MVGSVPGANPSPAAATSVRPKLIGLKEITLALKAYREKNKSLPDDLEKLVQDGFLPHLPVPPANMVFEIDKTAVEVKLVNK